MAKIGEAVQPPGRDPNHAEVGALYLHDLAEHLESGDRKRDPALRAAAPMQGEGKGDP